MIDIKDIDLINKFTRRELTEDEVYTFGVTLCDNDVDRDFEAFNDDALESLAELFIGKGGIFDHSAQAADQWARIYSTEIQSDTGRKTADGREYKRLFAKAYMVRTADNESLIKEIDAGIKREVSVSCAVNDRSCSICSKGSCSHVRGKSYGGKLCFHILSDATDAYEWSFVAIPAQRSAGVSKGFAAERLKSRLNSGGETAIIEKAELQRLIDENEKLKNDAAFFENYRRRLICSVKAKAAAKGGKSSVGAIAERLSIAELEAFARETGLFSNSIMPQLAAKNENNDDIKYYK